MQSVRNKLEYPTPAEVSGTTRYDANKMRIVILKHGQAVQDAVTGNVTTVTTTYQALPSDGVLLCGTGSYTVTLPAIANVNLGHTIRIKKVAATGTLTIDGSGSETVNGAATVTTANNQDTITVVCTSTTGWDVVGYAATVTATERVQTITTQTTTATVAATDDITIDTGTSAHTLTLPAVSGLSGTVLRFKKTGVSGAVTIDGNGAETIDGAANIVLTEQYETAELFCNGTAWFRINNAPNLVIQSVTTTDTVLPNSDVVLITAEAGAYDIALPLPAARGTGKTIVIKKTTATGAEIQTLTTPGAETIDGAASYAITEAYRSVTLLSDGTNWHVLNSDTPAASS